MSTIVYTNSLGRALEYLRDYTARLLQIERVDPRQGGDVAVDPTYASDYVAVRWGGIQTVREGVDVTLSEPYEREGVLVADESLEAPRMRLRVFLDIHSGGDEEVHLMRLSRLLETHTPTSPELVEIGEGYELHTETLEPSVQSDVYNTILTGWLHFDLDERTAPTTGAVLREVEILLKETPALEGATLETWRVEEVA
jgi:hypothetical protein